MKTNLPICKSKFDYLTNRYALACLEQARRGKSDVCFGSVLVKNNKIIGKGWNRRATEQDRKRLSHVDYAIHAEQAAILDAIDNGYNPKNGTIYVLGFANSGPKSFADLRLTIRENTTKLHDINRNIKDLHRQLSKSNPKAAFFQQAAKKLLAPNKYEEVNELANRWMKRK
jgi:hypothetical protein